LPYKDFQHCINIAIDRYKENLFSYGDAQGLKSLIETLCKQFRNYQIFTKEEKIFLTSGSQQALSILSSMNFPNGKNNVLIEQPTYHGIIEALRIKNVRTLGIERSFTGMDFNELERIFRNGNIKFFYTIPRFSNPMGLSYTKQEKVSILKLAKKYDVYIIEDDYLADLATDAKEDSMFSMDEDNRVIYIKSFSKILLPGLRIGAVVLPKLLIKTFGEYKKWADLSTPVLSQGALEIYINSGMFEIHKRKMTELYSRRMDMLGKTLEGTAGKDIVYNKPSSGIFSGFIINKKVESSKLIKDLLEKNIVLQDCSKLFLKEFYDESIFRISVSRADEAMIKEGIPKIMEYISQYKASKNNFSQINLEF
jgi:DNA-binding transcriptional MocR family regulator